MTKTCTTLPVAMSISNEISKSCLAYVSTRILITNATGSSLRLIDSKNLQGRVTRYPFEEIIENGQLGISLHHPESSTFSGSEGAAIYRDETNGLDIGIFWSVPYEGNNRWDVIVKKQGIWEEKKQWIQAFKGLVKKDMTQSDRSTFQHGLEIRCSMQNIRKPILNVVIMKHK
ncbi:MAG: hypothetical protein HRT90_06875 [Candidatus Margulisbacteria bacterium]|nr:hypothetical protein [Candidatus Margulisiibacteriota bacterium]